MSSFRWESTDPWSKTNVFVIDVDGYHPGGGGENGEAVDLPHTLQCGRIPGHLPAFTFNFCDVPKENFEMKRSPTWWSVTVARWWFGGRLGSEAGCWYPLGFLVAFTLKGPFLVFMARLFLNTYTVPIFFKLLKVVDLLQSSSLQESWQPSWCWQGWQGWQTSSMLLFLVFHLSSGKCWLDICLLSGTELEYAMICFEIQMRFLSVRLPIFVLKTKLYFSIV